MRTAKILAAVGLVVPLIMPTVPPSHADVAPTCDGKVATVVLPAVANWWESTTPVVGTPGDDVIVGSEGHDTIDGGLGDDVICGLSGADVLSGGPGNDRLFGGQDAEYVPDEDGYFGDLVEPGPGDDYVDLGADQDSRGAICSCDPGHHWDRVSFTSASGGVSVDLSAGSATGEGTDVIVVPQPGLSAGIVGSPYDDVLLGSAAKDLILAGDGSDVVEGRAGKDDIGLYEVTDVHDRADGGEGNDFVSGGSGIDLIEGGEGDDWLMGGGRSTLRGGAGRDELRGTSATTLSGGAGDDELQLKLESTARGKADGGGGGNKLWLVLPQSDFEPGLHLKVDVPRRRISINSRTVIDLRHVRHFVLDSPAGQFTFLGGPADEIVIADGQSRVRAFGRGGRDYLTGGVHADLLDGGSGRDRLFGRKGRDSCMNGERFDSCELRS